MDKKVLIAIPTVDYLHWRFAESLVKLQEWCHHSGLQYEIKFEGGTLVYLARDRLARYAASRGFTHILWLDADMVFEPDILDDLMENDKDFVTALIVSRHKDNGSVIFKDLSAKKRFETYPDKPFEIEGCGLACALIRIEPIKWIMGYYGSCFIPTLEYGEDLAFCEKMLKHGYSMCCDPSVVVGHIGQAIVYPDGTKKLI